MAPTDADGQPGAAWRVPFTLRALVVLVGLQASVEAAAVAGRDELTVGLRAALVLVVAGKWACAWGAARLRAGPALGLLLLQGTTVLAALGATDLDDTVRMLLAGVALLAIVLLLVSLSAFPSPTLPSSLR